MNNDLLNVRFGAWHFHILRDRPYIAVARNSYHDTARLKPGWRWFALYTMRWR
jgi:hypothetical protein